MIAFITKRSCGISPANRESDHLGPGSVAALGEHEPSADRESGGCSAAKQPPAHGEIDCWFRPARGQPELATGAAQTPVLAKKCCKHEMTVLANLTSGADAGRAPLLAESRADTAACRIADLRRQNSGGGCPAAGSVAAAWPSARDCLTRLHRSRRLRGCFARRPVARLGSRSVGIRRPEGALPHCEDPTVRAGAVPRRLSGKRSEGSTWRLLGHESGSAGVLAGRHGSGDWQALLRPHPRHQRRTRVRAKAQLRAERQPRPERRRRGASRDWRISGPRTTAARALLFA